MWKFCSCFILYHSLSVFAGDTLPVKVEIKENELPYYCRAASMLASVVSVFAVHLDTAIMNKQLAGMCDNLCQYDSLWGKVQDTSFTKLENPKNAQNILADSPKEIRAVCEMDFSCKESRAYRLTERKMVDFVFCHLQDLSALNSRKLYDSTPAMVQWATRVNNYVAGRDDFSPKSETMVTEEQLSEQLSVTEEQLSAYMTTASELTSSVSHLLEDSGQVEGSTMRNIAGTCAKFCSYQHYWARLENKDPEDREELKVPNKAIEILLNHPQVIEELCERDFICRGTFIHYKSGNKPVQELDRMRNLLVFTSGQFGRSISDIKYWKKRMDEITGGDAMALESVKGLGEPEYMSHLTMLTNKVSRLITAWNEGKHGSFRDVARQFVRACAELCKYNNFWDRLSDEDKLKDLLLSSEKAASTYHNPPNALDGWCQDEFYCSGKSLGYNNGDDAVDASYHTAWHERLTNFLAGRNVQETIDQIRQWERNAVKE